MTVAAAFLVASPPASAYGGAPPSPPARAWILVDPRDGAVLAAHEPGRALPIASTTKLMTAYLALHDLPLRATIVAPPYHPIPGESLMGLRAGERVSVRSLLYGLLLPSGNDAAVTLAEGDSGSVSAFVTRMNETARRLGLEDTHYANPVGLDQPGNYSSARDLAHLTSRLRRDPLFRRIVDTPHAEVSGAHPERVTNHNDLVHTTPWVNGVKTGYTADAGYVLVGSGTRKGVTLVSVLLGAPSIEGRDDGTLDLLRYGFSLYRREWAVRRGERLGTAPVEGVEAGVPLVAARPVRIVARRDQRVGTELRPPRSVAAPVRRGRRLGLAKVTVDGKPVASVPLVAARHVAATSGGGIPAWPWSAFVAVTGIVILIGWLIRRGGGRASRGSLN